MERVARPWQAFGSIVRSDVILVIGTHPRPAPEGTGENADNPSIMGIEFATPDHATLTVSAGESFTLVRVRPAPN